MSVVQPDSSNLRPRSVGRVFDSVFRQYRKHFSYIAIATLCIMIPYLILNGLFNYGTYTNYQSLLGHLGSIHSMKDLAALNQKGGAGMSAVTFVLSILDVLVVRPLLYGILLHLVVRELFGQPLPNLSDAFSHALRRLLAVIGTNIVVWAIWIVGFLIVSLLLGIGIGIMVAAKVSTALVIAVGVILFLIVLGAAIWYYVRFAFASSAVREEQKGVGGAFVRTWVLTRKNFWRLVGFFILLWLISVALGIGFSALEGVFGNAVVTIILTAVLALFLTPFSMLSLANMYVDLRVRTDALDMQQWLPEQPSNDTV